MRKLTKAKITDNKLEAKIHLRESREDEALAFLSSIGQIIDDVEITAKSMEELHKDTEDVNLTEEEEARAVIREDRDQVSTVDSRGIANDKNAEIIHLLNDDASRVNNEEIDECSDSDDDSDDELVEEDPGIGTTATANDDTPTVAAANSNNAMNLRSISR